VNARHRSRCCGTMFSPLRVGSLLIKLPTGISGQEGLTAPADVSRVIDIYTVALTLTKEACCVLCVVVACTALDNKYPLGYLALRPPYQRSASLL
jgi:hypothetical protein